MTQNPPVGTPDEAGRPFVMVIDDEPANLKLINATLAHAGHCDVLLVADPADVLDRYRHRRPDLILLDLNMPGLSGFDILARLAALDDPLRPPVIVLTAQSDEASRVRALESGASDFVTKPFARRELIARVQNLLALQSARRTMADRAATLEHLVAARTAELRRSRLEIVERLGRASAMRDDETGRHVMRISRIAALLARRIGWTPQRCELILVAAPMHDIGKIGIPDAILLKPGPLSPAEREVMRTHTTIGGELLGDSDDPLLVMAREIALFHHEHWDGSGYPSGLAGEAIPESARIVAITDVFDALLSERPYKTPWTVARALALLHEHAGRQFDPRLVAEFEAMLPQVLQVRARHADRPPHAPAAARSAPPITADAET